MRFQSGGALWLSALVVACSPTFNWRNATLEGNAQRLNRRDGSRLFADRLTWAQQTQQVIAQGRVRYSQPRLRL